MRGKEKEKRVLSGEGSSSPEAKEETPVCLAREGPETVFRKAHHLICD